MRRAALAVVALLCAGCASAATTTAASGSSQHPTTVATHPTAGAWLWQLAEHVATSNRGSVASAQAVRSTHSHAAAVTTGDGVPGDQAVWVLQVQGTRPFVCRMCKIPPGATDPTGRYITLIVDATTLQTMDFGVGNRRTDLAKLGTVLDLRPTK